ncbi:helix-turn-helix domain-containing protein [Nonomuraea cavernae]|uniref:AraC family transcriptional regulator n=1 Tax=Nonomuraea cavernae TaxID=2045107 RepID=A0A917Z9X6_9ACTN|nr:helix-turn-helix transcriptional regulator [Nonomuraea cavernae]MCA2190201.1 helix-turn-helix transcriptional regulator [Nonomuraea cavernae]GGO78740.1 AraC family transcriptional regulator [Nonomuraea cavernae]
MNALGPAMVEAAPGPALRPYVTRLTAYREHYGRPVTRSEAAMPGAVLILGFGAPTEVAGRLFTSFTGGLGDRFTVTRTSEPTEGVQVFLTPFGARRLFGLPMRQLANVVVPAEDVLGRWARDAVARLAETPSWRDRLALADRLLTRRILAGPELGPEVPWAWARLVGSGGALRVSSLADSLGWSHRHLVARFHDQVGLTPKAAARVIRFDRAARLVRAGVPIAEVAASCGFYDQAHLNREFRTLGGLTPGQIRPRPGKPPRAD